MAGIIKHVRAECNLRTPTDDFAEQNGRDAERADSKEVAIYFMPQRLMSRTPWNNIYGGRFDLF